MLNKGLLEIIVFCLKLIAYSSNYQMADIDMLREGHYQGAIAYKIVDKKMNISLINKGDKNRIMTVTTIDNGLYSLQLKGEKPFTVDLSPYYMQLNWKCLVNVQKKIKTKQNIYIKLTSSPRNVYVTYGSMTFVIDKSLLKKRDR